MAHQLTKSGMMQTLSDKSSGTISLAHESFDITIENKSRSKLMKKASMLLLAAGLVALPGLGVANDFSTVTRVHYVQDCIKLNEGKMNIYETTYKCSCVVDKLAEVFTQSQFEDVNAGFQYRNLPGDRGGMFRDDTDVKDGITLFQETHVAAYESCRIRR